jgi:thiol-disulfide isomerase/thioredoxin
MGRFAPVIALLTFLFMQACGTSNHGDQNSLSQGEEGLTTVILENRIYEISNSKDLSSFRNHYLAGGMVLFKFGAKWCGPCLTMKRTALNTLAKNSIDGNYMILDIDIDHKLSDDWNKFLKQFKGNGSGVPNGSIYVNKKRVYSYVGVRSANVLAPLLKKHKKAIQEPVDQIPSDQDTVVGDDTTTETNKLLPTIMLGQKKLSINTNEKGHAVSLLEADGNIIDLLNDKQFILDGMTYKIMKKNDIVSFLLLCDGMSCQPIDIYSK